MHRPDPPEDPGGRSPAAEADLQYVLEGGGEMGALMRSMDWSRTALGPVEDWPQSLRTTVSTCLNSRFPILIWWGPELVKIYNDAYRPMLGDKHPQSMGARGRDVWPEIWHIIGPMLEGVLERGEATWSENEYLPLVRHGFVEECYFTFSYSPIRGEPGEGIVGVYCAVAETTNQVIAARRLSTLHDVARRTAEASTTVEACQLAAMALAENSADLPFVLLYLLEEEGARARLVASAGLSEAVAEHTASASVVDLSEGSSGLWPLGEVARTERAEYLPELEGTAWEWLAPGNASGAPTSTFVVPMGRSADARPVGMIVAGVSPRLRFDDRYRSFLELIAGETATAVFNARALQEAMARARELAELDRAKTTFFSNVSHEFRTPLTLMMGPTEDALTSPEPALTGDDLQMVYRNELRLLKLVNALLDFSRLEAGRAEASYEPTDLSTLTADLASAFRSTIERGGLRFDVDCPPLPQPVYVDREMWEKIVLNLLSNAFKFTLAGTIGITLRAVGDHAELEVRDTGVGVAEGELPRLFERFHRIPGTRSRTHEGSGIGLALIKSLVELHGGSIGVTSTPGEGSVFTVSIPFGHAHLAAERLGAPRTLASTATGARAFVEEASRWLPDEGGQPTRVGASRAEEAAPASARVLVVDDNADVRDYLARLLGRHWTVETAADGAEALEAVRRAPPDLVLTDVMMPNLDGFALLSALRADPATAGVRVIILSARAGEESRVEGMAAGADDYLVKPFSARELVARVSAQLAMRQHARERANLLGREQAARREAELQRQHLVSLFMQAPTPIAILRGPDHVVELANPHTCRLWGRSRDEVLGKPLLEALPELANQPFSRLLDRVYESGEPYEGKETPARIDWNGDGVLNEVRLNFVYSPLRNIEGDIEGVLVIAFDVTDEVTARMRMSELRAEAEVANRAKDEFLAMLGHELRNPLAPILTALQLMRLRGGDELEKERLIIERQADQLVRLIDDLLDVSRITRGKVDLKRERVEMSEVVARAIETASPALEQREHHLAVKVPHGLVVEGDSARLTQVIANLLMNAAKYTEHGGRVTVVGERDADEIVIRVRDNGIGIAPEQLPKVFGMFTQERQSIDRSSGGLGLGLAIVKSLVGMHGGSVGVESAGRGLGSEFTVRLPAAIERGEEAGAVATGTADAKTNGGRRILVVDDNIDAAESLAEFVEAIGHTPRVAHDGPAALRVAEEFDPEIALIDIGLPILDGHELARHMRERLDLRQVRLIAVTGYGQEADRERTRRAGFDAHLVKPVDLAQLRALIESYVAEMP